MRKLLTGIATMTLFVLLALPVAAQEEGLPCNPTAHGNGPASGCTVQMHNLTETFTDVVPCTDVSADVTISDANLVFHITQLANGTYWATFTEEGRFTAVAPRGYVHRSLRRLGWRSLEPAERDFHGHLQPRGERVRWLTRDGTWSVPSELRCSRNASHAHALPLLGVPTRSKCFGVLRGQEECRHAGGASPAQWMNVLLVNTT